MKLRPEPLLVGLACLGPFVLALVVYFGPFSEQVLPVVENAERELLADRRLPALGLETASGEAVAAPWAGERWALLFVTRLPCETACRDALERLEQVHGALGADRHRMQRGLLYAGETAPAVDDAGLLRGRLEPARAEQWRALFGDALAAGAAGRFFVADPLGNLVVAYPAGADRRGMLEDLERLLDVSRIG